MVELNFDELTDEEIQYFCEEYSNIFQRVCDDLVNKRQSLVKSIGEEPVTVNNLKVTPLAKILFMAKKIAKNALISTFTGIETMHLDSDTRPLARKGREFYMQQHIVNLIYDCERRLEEITREVLRTLNLENIEEKRNIIRKMDSFYRECFYSDYGSGKLDNRGQPREYGLVLAALYRDIYKDEDIATRVYAAYQRGTTIPPQYDFYKDMKDVYTNFLDKKMSKIGR